ncbi:nucleotidyltransferase [Akkermansiaceae bacterium]|nr:nucleotidyltransferase [Akkermansiaceae bacterium]
MKPTLLVLAAGMGSRYGGLKQMDPMGPSGETVLDYSVYDAIRAGFGKVVFVIREEFAEAFSEQIVSKFEDEICIELAFQKLDDLPPGFIVPEGREKPWGTTHAIYAARSSIDGPFAIINADDFYGRDGLNQVSQALQAIENSSEPTPKEQYVIVAYKLANTLSAHGTVNRGICTYKEQILSSVEEYTEISVINDTTCEGTNEKGEKARVSIDSLVSMNLWGFPLSVMPHIESHFIEFLENRITEPKSECYIPTVVDSLIQSGVAECNLVSSESQWFGVTYPDDKAQVVKSIAALVKKGEYPEKLWN